MFAKVLVANRGEIAVRIARTCRDLGVATVAVHSDPDAAARHVALADEAVRLPGASPAETYLDVERIVRAALETGAEAVHPGYGFLAERADAAEAVRAAGLVWVGPSPEAIRAAGEKVRARRLAEGAAVPVVPGTLDLVRGVGDVRDFGERHGYPVAIKASGGGGGRGLKVVRSAEEVERAHEAAVREATAYFGRGDVYLERYLDRPKHVEVQVLAPEPGRAMWLGARDCSLQRRHQKLVEEAPPPAFPDLVAEMGRAAVRVADACGYANAGTVEFLVEAAATPPRFYFLEINARLQVEHTVTEEVLGLDLVAAQLRIAAGEPVGFDPDDLRPGGRLAPRGHAIECRINAEDPALGFLPAPGRLSRYREPSGPGVRVDSGYGEGDEVPAEYDSLVAKVIARGANREEARRRMLRALAEFDVQGVRTTIPAHLALLSSPAFEDGGYTTATVEEVLAPLAAASAAGSPLDGGPVLLVNGVPARLWHPALAGSVSSGGGGGGGGSGAIVTAPMHGTILEVLVSPGDEVAAGASVAVLEAMKMETALPATRAGRVRDVAVAAGVAVEAGQTVAVIE